MMLVHPEVRNSAPAMAGSQVLDGVSTPQDAARGPALSMAPGVTLSKEGAGDMAGSATTFSIRRVLGGLAIAIAFVIIIGAIWGRGGSETEAGYAPSQTVSERVSAADLVVAYARNEVAADIRFKDKIIIVGGRIETIGKGGRGLFYSGPYVSLVATGFTSVECMFAEKDIPELSRLQPWQTVRIRGRCDGSPYSDIELRECELVW